VEAISAPFCTKTHVADYLVSPEACSFGWWFAFPFKHVETASVRGSLKWVGCAVDVLATRQRMEWQSAGRDKPHLVPPYLCTKSVPG